MDPTLATLFAIQAAQRERINHLGGQIADLLTRIDALTDANAALLDDNGQLRELTWTNLIGHALAVIEHKLGR